MRSFYHAANASRAVKLPNGKRVAFDVYKYFAGAWLGIAAVEDPETIEGLDELVIKPKSGITRITEEEYKAALKKKPPAPSYRPSTVSLSPPQAAIQLVGTGPAARPAAVVDNPEKAAPAPAVVTPRVYDSVDEVLSIGSVKATETGGPLPPKRDTGERSARATSGQPSRRPKYQSEEVHNHEEAA